MAREFGDPLSTFCLDGGKGRGKVLDVGIEHLIKNHLQPRSLQILFQLRRIFMKPFGVFR